MSGRNSLGGALALHHTGVLVRDIDAAEKHYTDSLGYMVESETMDDPIQTARVKFLRLSGANHWLELIAPLGAGSKLNVALAKGGGLHHLCYEATDLEASLERMRGQGFLILCAPVQAVAFPGRRIAWAMDRNRLLLELLDARAGPLSLAGLSAVTQS